MPFDWMRVSQVVKRMDPLGLTLVVFAVQMGGMATVHPPARAVLQGTVPVEFVVIVVEGAELLAVVGRVELVAGIVTKVEAGKGVAGIAAKEEAVHQTVLVGFTSDPEHVVVGVPGGRIHVRSDIFLFQRFMFDN